MRFFQPFIGYFKGLPILLTFLLIFGYGDPAEAANASHKNKAEELLKLVKIENQLGQIVLQQSF